MTPLAIDLDRLAMDAELSADRLRALLSYDPETGVFSWVHDRGNGRKGLRAGYVNEDGYTQIRILGTRYPAARLAWLYMVGQWPPAIVDHKDLNRSNDRWENLRLATVAQNAQNTAKSPRNTSGFKGVSWDQCGGKWSAGIRVNGKNRFLGYFEAPEEAHAAYCAAAAANFGEFARVV